MRALIKVHCSKAKNHFQRTTHHWDCEQNRWLRWPTNWSPRCRQANSAYEVPNSQRSLKHAAHVAICKDLNNSQLVNTYLERKGWFVELLEDVLRPSLRLVVGIVFRSPKFVTVGFAPKHLISC